MLRWHGGAERGATVAAGAVRRRGPGRPTGDAGATPSTRARRPDSARRLRRRSATPTSARPRDRRPSFYSRADAVRRGAAARAARLGALIGAGTLAGLRHDFREQLRLGIEARRVAPEPGPAADRDGRRPDRARAATATRGARSSGWWTRSPASPRTRASRTSASCPATWPARSRRCAWRCPPAAAPENRAYVQALLGDLELERGRVGRGARRLPRRAARPCRASRRRSSGSHGSTRRAATCARPPPACAARRERLPLDHALTLLAEVERALGTRAAAAADLAAARAQHRLLRAAGPRRTPRRCCSRPTTVARPGGRGSGRRVWRAAPSMRSADALGWALHARGAAARGAAHGRGGRCGSARAIRCSGSTPACGRARRGRAAGGAAVSAGGGEGGGDAVARLDAAACEEARPMRARDPCLLAVGARCLVVAPRRPTPTRSGTSPSTTSRPSRLRRPGRGALRARPGGDPHRAGARARPRRGAAPQARRGRSRPRAHGGRAPGRAPAAGAPRLTFPSGAGGLNTTRLELTLDAAVRGPAPRRAARRHLPRPRRLEGGRRARPARAPRCARRRRPATPPDGLRRYPQGPARQPARPTRGELLA